MRCTKASYLGDEGEYTTCIYSLQGSWPVLTNPRKLPCYEQGLHDMHPFSPTEPEAHTVFPHTLQARPNRKEVAGVFRQSLIPISSLLPAFSPCLPALVRAWQYGSTWCVSVGPLVAQVFLGAMRQVCSENWS